MPEAKKIKADDSAEQAYAAAAAEQPFSERVQTADAAEVPEPVAPAPLAEAVEEVTFPPKAKRGRKPVAAAKIEAPEPASNEPVIVVPEKATKPVAARKGVQRAKVVARRVTAKPLPAPVPPKLLMKPKIKVVSRPVETKKTTVPSFPTHSNIKDSVMDMSTNFTESFKGIFVDAQEKAKEAFSKGNAVFGDYNEFTKGNVDAVVESGKILAAGLQDIGTNLVAESRSAFETVTADIKELTSVKSPADFFRLQSDLVRRNFDSAVAYGSKSTEAVLKLASEVAAPLSGRVSVAVEKVRQPA